MIIDDKYIVYENLKNIYLTNPTNRAYEDYFFYALANYDEKSVIEGWKEFQVFVKQRNNQYYQNVKKC